MDKEERKQKFVTDRRIVSYTTSVSAMSRTELMEPEEDEDTDDGKPVLVSDFISPWNLALPNMSFGRHSHGIAAIGNQFSIVHNFCRHYTNICMQTKNILSYLTTP